MSMNYVSMLICPNSGEEIAPLKLWESRLPDGRVVRYGQFQLHFHWGKECEWSYMVQPLTECPEQFPPLFI